MVSFDGLALFLIFCNVYLRFSRALTFTAYLIAVSFIYGPLALYHNSLEVEITLMFIIILSDYLCIKTNMTAKGLETVLATEKKSTINLPLKTPMSTVGTDM